MYVNLLLINNPSDWRMNIVCNLLRSCELKIALFKYYLGIFIHAMV